ncbi:unnamed protein product, partial [Nesidiocoris tenuis]
MKGPTGKTEKYCRQQLTASILITKIRESPYVAKTNGESDAGQNELHFPAPFFSGDNDRSAAHLCSPTHATG